MAANQGMIRGALAGGGPARGGLGLGVGVTDNLRIEVAGDLGDKAYAMGSAGLRFTQRSADRRAAFDVELGGGAGLGGQRCGNNQDTTVTCAAGTSDGRRLTDRFAFGGYAGLGAGFRLSRYFELYARTRLQRSTSENIPATWWFSGLGGVDVLLGPINLNAGIGYGHYFNSAENNGSVILEVGATVPLNALSFR